MKAPGLGNQVTLEEDLLFAAADLCPLTLAEAFVPHLASSAVAATIHFASDVPGHHHHSSHSATVADKQLNINPLQSIVGAAPTLVRC